MKKTAPINILVEPDIKKKLQEKARALNINLTQYIEKIGKEPVVFIDENFKAMFKAMSLNM
jgi:hypothetical protein